MPQSISASIALTLQATLNNALNVGSASYPLAYNASAAFSNGAGANQAKDIFTDRRTLAASAAENLDLVGVLANAYGASISFTKIKALIVVADKANANDVVIGGHATAACASFFGDATDTVKVKPGGIVAFIAPDANGYAVAATTADMLKVANSGAGSSVTYDIIILGTT